MLWTGDGSCEGKMSRVIPKLLALTTGRTGLQLLRWNGESGFCRMDYERGWVEICVFCFKLDF